MKRSKAGINPKSERKEESVGRNGSSASPDLEGLVASLHKTVGNQAMQQFHRYGDLQAKLNVSQPDDEAERESRQVAEEVMRMSLSDTDSEVVEGIQRMASIERSPNVNGETIQQIKSMKGGGRPLSPSIRSFFEPRFGRDFSDVRIHTGPRADAAAGSINAEAFTHGTDVVFKRGRFRPETTDGKELLAHELTHVVQQSGVSKRIQRQSTDTSFNQKISGSIPSLSQSTPNLCWATVTTMMLSWKDQRTYSINEAIQKIGSGSKTSLWENKFHNNRGLNLGDMPLFLDDTGFIAEPRMTNITVNRIRNLIRKYGPLWVNTDVNMGSNIALHARVVTGIWGDGSPSGTTISLINPIGGNRNTLSFQNFLNQFVEDITNPRISTLYQLLHWPENAGPDPPEKDVDTKTTYRVKPGDTLWDIAERKYGDGSKYPAIVRATNQKKGFETIQDPSMIYPDQRLVLPPESET
jgi:nucleoid-associated protein YgaU